jgi:glycosidase
MTRPLIRSAASLMVLAGVASGAWAQAWDENPQPMLQWFECRWYDMEHRMSDFFAAGYGSVWVPPPSRGYMPPTNANQNSSSAGFDVFDRFDLGKPGATSAYGTEASFGAVVEEFHRANGLVYIDAVLNHNAGRQTSVQFQQEGGYPGFWMAPTTPITSKTSTSNWGDFHNGNASGYYQSHDPGGSNYCLLRGDLVSLVDINHSTTNMFIRQPVAAGNAQNLPAGTYFNKVDPANARFYPDQALGSETVNNPGMFFAGALNTGIFAAPCDIPARNEPPSSIQMGRFNSANPMAGDAVAENATGYLMRWVQWMMDVQKVDGFRIDAIKHTPSWFWDTFYDSAVANRLVTPDGRRVTPYSFGECVEGNDFTFDRYVRKPNGRTSGRSASGDAFGNRDCLDLNGAGQLRDLINGGGFGSWQNVLNAHLDNTDDGFNNGSVGTLHIFSHDNGSTGDGGSNPPTPTVRQQGWYAHAYMLFRPGVSEVYHNARGVVRTGSGFYPRQGLPVALGANSATNALEPALTTLVQLSNGLARGEFTPRWTDGDVLVFERRTATGGGGYSGNCLVGVNDSYASGFDSRTVSTSFPQGTRLVELTGTATSATTDPNNDLFDIVTVGAGGSVTIRVPRNVSPTGVEHNRGYVVYAPAIPSGTLTIAGASSSLPSELGVATIAPWRRRALPVPVVTGATFQVQLTTTNGDPGAANNDNADDNAVFRINQGFFDFNGNGQVDIDYTNAVVPGYEQFITTRQPLANTTNTNGVYAQTISTSQLQEGLNYVSVAAFRKRAASEAPLFREFRTALYVDRLDPTASIVDPGVLFAVTSHKFLIRTDDRTVSRVHLILNPPATGNPLSLATTTNQAVQDDRWDWSRTLNGLQVGENTVLLLTFEESGRGVATYYTVNVTNCGTSDFNGDGDFGTDADIEAFFACLAGSCCPTCFAGGSDFNGDGDFGTDADIESFFRVLGGGNC